MVRRMVFAFAAVAGVVGAAQPAGAGVSASVCYDVSVTVNGGTVVDEAGCQVHSAP